MALPDRRHQWTTASTDYFIPVTNKRNENPSGGLLIPYAVMLRNTILQYAQHHSSFVHSSEWEHDLFYENVCVSHATCTYGSARSPSLEYNRLDGLSKRCISFTFQVNEPMKSKSVPYFRSQAGSTLLRRSLGQPRLGAMALLNTAPRTEQLWRIRFRLYWVLSVYWIPSV